MADNPRTYQPSTVEANRSAMQGNGFGQKDMNQQQQPTREEHATAPQRTEPFDNDPAGTGDDRGQGSSDMGAGAVSQGGANSSGAAREDRSFDRDGESRADDRKGDEGGGRDAAGIGDVGDLGAGTPANVDIHNLGQGDKPEQDWGEPAEGATYSSTNTNRGGRTELERSQGAKTRQMNKDIVSRRT